MGSHRFKPHLAQFGRAAQETARHSEARAGTGGGTRGGRRGRAVHRGDDAEARQDAFKGPQAGGLALPECFHSDEGSGCMKNTDRTWQLVNGGVQLYVGGKEAMFQMGKMYLLRSPDELYELLCPAKAGNPEIYRFCHFVVVLLSFRAAICLSFFCHAFSVALPSRLGEMWPVVYR